MTQVITPAKAGDAPAAARLLADTMAGFGISVLGAGDETLELRALTQWFGETENRFSHQFAQIARFEGEISGLLLGFPGREAGRLSLACRHSILKVYRLSELARLIWRGIVLGLTREAQKDEFLVAHVSVFPQYQRKGIASSLLDKAVLMAKDSGLTKLALEVEIGNEPAITCYERFGFRTQFTTRFGRYADLLQCPGYHKMLRQL
jgi:ribosomal protein S18 acetylase RimI-like enzyme